MPPKNRRKKASQKKKPHDAAKESQAERQAELEKKMMAETPQVSETEKVEAARYKALGNAALATSPRDAVKHYTAAIDIDASDHVFWSNRSAAYLSLGNTKAATYDAEQCVQLNAEWPKGYSRLGAAMFAAGEFQKAINAFTTGLGLDASNESMKQMLANAEKRLSDGEAPSSSGGGGGAAVTMLEPEPQPEPAVGPGGYTPGDKVLVSGLKGAAQHNGKDASIVSFDAAKGRWVVKLSTGENIALKPENISPPAAQGQVDEIKACNKVIGIDLGTTNSCVGVWIDDEVVILTSQEGRKTVPSFVSFDGDRRYVGDEAKAMQTRNIANTVYDAKRCVGHNGASLSTCVAPSPPAVLTLMCPCPQHYWHANVQRGCSS